MPKTSEQLFDELDQSSEIGNESASDTATDAATVPVEPKKKGKKADAKAILPLLTIQREDVGHIGASPLRLGLLLRLDEPVTHMNPGSGDKSNFSRLRREPMLRPRPTAATDVIGAAVERLQQQFPVPAEVVADFETMTPAQYIAAVIARVCYDLCYSWDSDRGRMCFGFLNAKPTDANTFWESVVSRLQQCAVGARSAREYIAALLASVQVRAVPSSMDSVLSAVYGLPQSAVELAMAELADNAALTLSDVRRWDKAERLARQEDRALVTLTSTTEPLQAVASAMETVWVPEVSAVSIRHNIRAGCSRHLLTQLGVGGADKLFSDDIERVLQNGGAMYAGSQESKSDRIMAARMTFPMLDLLGGCLPDAMLGNSQLLLHVPRLVCRETADILPPAVQALPQATAPAESMVGSRSYARASMPGEADGMPYGREVILEGAAIYVGITVRPYTPLLTLGALIAGIKDWWDNAPGIGGAQANGFGQIEGSWVFDEGQQQLTESAEAAYNRYLATNREGLLQRLQSGRIDEL